MPVAIPENRQYPGWLVGSPWVVMQAWAVADLWTIALLGPEGGRIVEGYGDWDVISVPRGKPITEWKGHRPYTMELDLLYDGWPAGLVRPAQPASWIGYPSIPWGGGGNWRYGRGEQIEAALDSLQMLATRQPGAATPYSLRMWGAVHYPAGRYVIQSLTWGDAIRDGNTGRRVRQQVTVTLIEYNQPGEIARLPRGKAS